MPLYEYQCDACGHRFEIIQKFSDPAIDACPVCGGTVHKLLSSPAIQFKGSGWYVTDYARKASPTDSSGGPSSEASGKDKISPPSDAASSGSSTSSSASSASKQS